jgi:glycosyltransferase involved in cell wall biosynthesis
LNKNPKISIITVSFNSDITIRDTIESIINQDYNNIEYIIIDAGSKDDTLDIIEEYEEHVSYFNSEPDKGIYDGMNKGITAATGDIIGILNSDDFYPNSFVISNVAKTFEKQGCDAWSLLVGICNHDDLQCANSSIILVQFNQKEFCSNIHLINFCKYWNVV